MTQLKFPHWFFWRPRSVVLPGVPFLDLSCISSWANVFGTKRYPGDHVSFMCQHTRRHRGICGQDTVLSKWAAVFLFSGLNLWVSVPKAHPGWNQPVLLGLKVAIFEFFYSVWNLLSICVFSSSLRESFAPPSHLPLPLLIYQFISLDSCFQNLVFITFLSYSSFWNAVSRLPHLWPREPRQSSFCVL